MKSTTHRLSVGKAIGLALGGIILSAVVTAIIFMGWFFFREVIMGNQDNLFAFMIQSVVCMALFVIGSLTSVVCAVMLWAGHKLTDRK